MLPSVTNTHFRIALSHVDRGIDRVRGVIVERHRAETAEHVILRVLAWCIFYDDELRFGPGLAARGAADLWAHDATGRPTIWVECGVAHADALRKEAQHSRGMAIHVLFCDLDRRAALVQELAELKRRPPEIEAMGIWSVDAELVARLAASDDRRQRWSVTVVGDHIYVESDGASVDCELARTPVPPPERP
jgi:uncharacterized protein YaeQ